MNKNAGKTALFVVFCLGLAGLSPAQEAPRRNDLGRPRIGLVLSGGGARGAAHIGVLKVLEENHIPVDAIAGTSMGAVVGGLYATGLSAADVERVMTSVDWQDAFRDRPARTDLNFRRKLEDQNFLVKFPLGLKGRRFRLPRGLVQGQKLTQILRSLTLPVAQIQSFDDLAIPFRAVATDIVTGERVVLDHGDLTTAMRASLSAPGVFSPVDLDGRMLVDGGLSSNLPVDVAREMGVDILIVVDCGFPLLERNKLESVATVSNQMLAILIRHNTAMQRKTLTERDIVIDPLLGDFSSLDFTEHERAMDIGETAARGMLSRLQALSVPPAEFQRIVDARAAKRTDLPRIQFLRIDPGSERYAGAIESLFGDQIGKVADGKRLEKRVSELYGQGNLEIFDYRLMQNDPLPGDAPEYGLALTTRRNSWGPNYLRFGLALQNDFEGNSSFNVAARGTLAEITKYGGEWLWDVQIGETPRVATEIYLPVGYRSRWFVAPHAQFQIRTLAIADEDEHILAEYRVRSTDYGIDLGRELGNYAEIRIGGGRSVGECAGARRRSLAAAVGVRCAQLLRRVSLRLAGRRQLSEAWQLVHARMAGRAGGSRRCGERGSAVVRSALCALLGAQHGDLVDVRRNQARLRRDDRPLVLLAGRVLQPVGHHAGDVGGPAFRDRARHLLPPGRAGRAGVPEQSGVCRCVDREGQRVGFAPRYLIQQRAHERQRVHRNGYVVWSCLLRDRVR